MVRWKNPWELHIIVKSLVEPKDKEVKRLVRPMIEWLICRWVKGRNEETSAKETDMNVVTLPSQKLKSWQKLSLEGTIEKWLKAQRVAVTYINSGSGVAAAASFSVSQVEIFFVLGANTTTKMNGAIAGDSETGRKKFTARQWAVLIGFCDVETRKQVKTFGRESKNSRDAMDVCTIVVTTIK